MAKKQYLAPKWEAVMRIHATALKNSGNPGSFEEIVRCGKLLDDAQKQLAKKQPAKKRVMVEAIFTFYHSEQQIGDLYLDLRTKDTCIEDLANYLAITGVNEIEDLAKVSMCINTADLKHAGKWYQKCDGKLYFPDEDTANKGSE